MKSYYKILLLVVILLCGTSKASKIDRAMLYAVQKGDIALIDKVIERGGNIRNNFVWHTLYEVIRIYFKNLLCGKLTSP